ncbi:tryptophan synthase subunit alpha [Orrella daihaiensis]|uniref:Tryptophan synthase alpha chain n=1 Tax=Orrella daihaiensis TaxID=2782176 RepID=A0ABY4ARF5_9BURK|nr:tryptophan synthase subunit alpha [Orrella daihaiensis]UOD51640.1 tryptophan synthase subunit alpha [Orrella daihaiensis]
MVSISKISDAFERSRAQRRAALIPYIAAGNPLPESTVPLMHQLVAAGADVIELGVPFSDPMADGPIIQRAAEHAISQGVGLKDVLKVVSEFRKTDEQTPIVLMGYANPIERMGQQAFVEKAAEAGVDGVLVVDYPPEEAAQFVDLLGQHDMAPIFLLAPTSTDERIAAVGKLAKGYVYYVSLRGVTGAGHLNTDEVASQLAKIRQHVTIPVGVGFGISDAQSASRVAEVADAVVIGSKLIDVMNKAWQVVPVGEQTDVAVTAGHDWLKGIRHALDQVNKQPA